MNVLIIEDEIVIARYFETVLSVNFTDLKVQIAVTIEEAEQMLTATMPEMILCDINLNDVINGIELIEKYRQKFAFELIFVTSYFHKEIVQRAIPAAPAHYLIKPVEEGQMLAVVEIVLNKLRAKNLGEEPRMLAIKDQLTKMEFEVLQWIAKGLSSYEISERLFVSPYTVKNHRHNICKKLGISVKGNSSILKWLTEHNLMFLATDRSTESK